VLQNLSESKTITYIALEVKEGDYYDWKSKFSPKDMSAGAAVERAIGPMKWQGDRLHTFYYKVTLLPKSSVKLKFKIRAKDFWSETKIVMGREKRWTDLISTEMSMPESGDPLK